LIKSPFSFFKISQYANIAQVFVSSSQDAEDSKAVTEVFGCQWKKAGQTGNCSSVVGKKPLLQWYRSRNSLDGGVIERRYTKDIWKGSRPSKVVKNTIAMFAER
jgi:hypothetical protein